MYIMIATVRKQRNETMRTRTRKKDRERFLATVIALLLNLGAQHHDDHFVLQTKAGRLTLYPNVYGSNELGTVFARFDDPKAARQIVECNPYSGKWNHHYFDGWTVETATDDFTARLRRVLP
jgi:hypothetical protein